MTYETIKGEKSPKARKYGKKTKSKAVRIANKRITFFLMGKEEGRADKIVTNLIKGWSW